MLRFSLLVGFILSWGCPSLLPGADKTLRDPEALYLDILGPDKKVSLTVEKTSPMYATRTFNAHVGNVVAGENVELVAWSKHSYLVRTAKDQREGWVSPSGLTPPDEGTIALAKAALEEEKVFQKAIEEKEILPGMTFEHVRAAKGKPDTSSFRTDENGRFDLWSYTEYGYRYEQRAYTDPTTGRLFYQTVRVKIPIGAFNVEFKEGRVTATEKTSAPPGSTGASR